MLGAPDRDARIRTQAAEFHAHWVSWCIYAALKWLIGLPASLITRERDGHVRPFGGSRSSCFAQTTPTHSANLFCLFLLTCSFVFRRVYVMSHCCRLFYGLVMEIWDVRDGVETAFADG
jgi:hypothetical protein